MGMYGSSSVLSGEAPRSSDRISMDALLLCRGSFMGEDDGRDFSGDEEEVDDDDGYDSSSRQDMCLGGGRGGRGRFVVGRGDSWLGPPGMDASEDGSDTARDAMVVSMSTDWRPRGGGIGGMGMCGSGGFGAATTG